MNLPWADEMAIDLGTANIHVCVKHGGVVVREPALVAYSGSGHRPVAYGTEARRMMERSVEGVRVIQPIRGGVVADFDAAVALVRHFIHRALGRRPMLNPVVVSARPTAATDVEQRALHDCLRAAGAGRVLTIPNALVSAMGADLPLDSVETILAVNIGAGATNIGAVSMGMLSAGASPRFGGDTIDEAIVRHVKRDQGIRISHNTAEEIKLRVGTADLTSANGNMGSIAASGDDLQAFEVSMNDIPKVVERSLTPIYDEILWLIEQLPPKARAEIGSRGITLAGGTALIKGLADHMAQALGIPVRVATDPMSCTILGLQFALGNLGSLSLNGRRFSHASTGGAA